MSYSASLLSNDNYNNNVFTTLNNNYSFLQNFDSRNNGVMFNNVDSNTVTCYSYQFAKKININLEKVFDHDEIINLLNYISLTNDNTIKLFKMSEILVTLSDKTDKIKYIVIIKYYKKTLKYKLFKSQRPENYPNKIDLLNLSKFFNTQEIIYEIYEYFDFIVSDCTLNEKILLTEYLSETNKYNFIKKFKILEQLTLKNKDTNVFHVELLLRILLTLNNELCGKLFGDYLSIINADFETIETLIDILSKTTIVNIFDHDVCGVILGREIYKFKEPGTFSYEKFLTWFNSDKIYNVFKVTSLLREKLKLDEILGILKLINASDIADFLKYCSRLTITENPIKLKTKNNYNKNYIGETENNYNKNYIVETKSGSVYCQDRLNIVLYLNSVINSSSSVKSISYISCKSYVLNNFAVVEIIKNLFTMLNKVEYAQCKLIFDHFQMMRDILNNYSINYFDVIKIILDNFNIDLIILGETYQSFKKIINENKNNNDTFSEEEITSFFFDNVIKVNLKNLHHMEKIMDEIDYDHYGIFLKLVYEKCCRKEIELFSNNDNENFLIIQSMTNSLCTKLDSKNISSSFYYYDKIAFYLRNLFWSYLLSNNNINLNTFETNILNLMILPISKATFCNIILKSRTVQDEQHYNYLIKLLSANVQYLDTECIENIDIKNTVNKSNIDAILTKFNKVEQKLATLEYLIQNEMENNSDCGNYIFSKLKIFLSYFKNSEYEFIVLISKYIDLSNRKSSIRANQDLFGSEYCRIITYVESLFC